MDSGFLLQNFNKSIKQQKEQQKQAGAAEVWRKKLTNFYRKPL